MSVTGISKFEAIFKAEGSLDIDKSDIKRIYDFTNHSIYRLLLKGMKNTSLNNRDVLWFCDLPITEGLDACINEFKKLNQNIEIEGILEAITKLPPLKYEYGEDVVNQLPDLAGGILIAFIKTFKIIEPSKKNPQTQDWEKIEKIFETLL